MAANDRAALEVVAFQLAARLEEYEAECREMVRTWYDADLYEQVSRSVDVMRLHCASIPQLSVPWVALLIAHTELVHCLWKVGADLPASAPRMQDCLRGHAAALGRLQERCIWLFSRAEH
ncbi:MAG TPA: hypothetical protein VGD76_17810 [Ramlibacter sp.]